MHEPCFHLVAEASFGQFHAGSLAGGFQTVTMVESGSATPRATAALTPRAPAALTPRAAAALTPRAAAALTPRAEVSARHISQTHAQDT